MMKKILSKSDRQWWKLRGPKSDRATFSKMNNTMISSKKLILRRGDIVVDKWGDRGVVVKIVPGTSHVDHGTVYVWQMDRTNYGADNCEHYPEFGWEDALAIIESVFKNEDADIAISASPTKTIFEKTYYGFEEYFDMERDIMECIDPKMNSKAEGIPAEFKGSLKVTISYEDDDK